MINNNDSINADFLANAGARLHSAPKSTNPFRAGLDRGMASWRESQEQWATTISVPKVAACPACAKQISTNTANCLHCDEPLSEGLWQQNMAKQEAKSMRKGGVILVLLLLIGLYVATRPEPRPLTTEQSAKAAEVDAVTACDIATRRSVNNPSSFETNGYWRAQVEGKHLLIRRNFLAMNAFGANLDSYYLCKFDFMTMKLVDLKLFDGNF